MGITRKDRGKHVLGAVRTRQVKKAAMEDLRYGKYPLRDIWKEVQAAAVDAVLDSTALLDGEYQTITVGITSPNAFRVLSVTGDDAGIDGEVVIAGEDWAGNVIEETITADGTNTVAGEIPFFEVTSITLPPQNTAGDEISVGVVDVFGLTRPIEEAADVIWVGIGVALTPGAPEFEEPAAVDVANRAVTLATAVTADDTITIEYYANEF